MTIKELIKHIAAKEAGKSNVKVGDIREIVGIISDLMYQNHEENQYEICTCLYKNGKRRAERKYKGSKEHFNDIANGRD
jgi:ferredoxin-thioredoxin reductase catalytic subunit